MKVPSAIRPLIAAGLLALATASPAAVLWSFTEAGGNVEGTLSGSIDLSGLSMTPAIKTGSNINPGFAILFSGRDGEATVINSAFVASAATQPFGSGPPTLSSATTGDTFVMYGQQLVLPAGYGSNDPLSGTLSVVGASFDSLGITPGTYVYTLTNRDTVTLQFGPATPVPAPGTLALAGLGLAALAAARRRRV